MKKVVFLVSLLSMLVACQDPAANPLTETGSIEGRALFTGLTDHSGIVITAESLDSAGKAQGSLSGQTTTDATGAYSLAGLPNGTYTIYASSADSLEKAVSIGVTVSEARAISVADLQLTATGSISGIATLEGQTSGNLGILVYVAGTSYVAFTREDGVFTISGVPVASNYLVVASFDGYSNSTPATVNVEAGATTTLATINLTKPVTVATVGSLAGTATLDDQNAGAQAGIFVYLNGSSALAMTDANGGFALNELAPGTYTLWAQKSGYDSVSKAVTVTAGSQTVVPAFSLSKTVVAATTGSVTGTATLSDRAAGSLAGIQVYLTGSSSLAVTDANGVFTLDNVAPGNYTLWAQKTGYDSVSKGIAVTAGQSTPAGTLALVVPAPPAPGAKSITALTFTNVTPVSSTVNEGLHTVSVIVPAATDLTTLVPVVTQTGASVDPPSNWQQDFSSPVVYTVTATDGSTQAYQVTVRKPSVTYDGQGATIGAIPSAQTVGGPSSTVVALPVSPLKTGYFFTGWSTAPSNGGTVFTGSSQVAGDMTVYANWAPSGSVWTARSLPSSANWISVTYGNGVFVAVAHASNAAATSLDGINWTARTLASSSTWQSVTYGNGVFVAISFTNNVANSSVDGINWTARTLPLTPNLTSVTYGNGVFVVVASGTSAATSPDGITWTARTLPNSANWSSVTYGNGLFLAVSNGSASAATSPDGVTWTARSLPSVANWRSAIFGNGTFVAVAENIGSVATSPDGGTWTLRALPSSSNWFSVTYGNGAFAIVTNGINAATSLDGISWTARTLPISMNWNSVTYGNGVFVSVSNGTNAATSF